MDKLDNLLDEWEREYENAKLEIEEARELIRKLSLILVRQQSHVENMAEFVKFLKKTKERG